MKSNCNRTSRRVTGLVLFLWIGAGWNAPAQTGKSEGNDIAALRAEVQKLSRELLQCRAELLEWKIQSLSSELRQVQAERQRIGMERQVIEREIGELNLASTNSPGAEDEGRREELANVQMPALLAGETAAMAREATLASALRAESARIQEIRQQLQRM